VNGEEPSKEIAVVVTDRLPHNYWNDEKTSTETIREQIRRNDADFKFGEQNFTHSNLEDRGSDVKVNYEEEIRPYLFKKHLVDVRDHAYFMDEGKPRKPLKDYLTLKNLAIGAVGFVALCILLGYIDEKLDNAILDDLKAEQKRIDEHLAREWAIRVQEWSSRWQSVKRWFGNDSSAGGAN